MINYRLLAMDGTYDEAIYDPFRCLFWFRGRLLTTQQILEETRGRVAQLPAAGQLRLDGHLKLGQNPKDSENQKTEVPTRYVVRLI